MLLLQVLKKRVSKTIKFIANIIKYGIELMYLFNDSILYNNKRKIVQFSYTRHEKNIRFVIDIPINDIIIKIKIYSSIKN